MNKTPVELAIHIQNIVNNEMDKWIEENVDKTQEWNREDFLDVFADRMIEYFQAMKKGISKSRG